MKFRKRWSKKYCHILLYKGIRQIGSMFIPSSPTTLSHVKKNKNTKDLQWDICLSEGYYSKLKQT